MTDPGRSIKGLLDELQQSDAPVRAALVYQLSEPNTDDMALFKTIWPTLPVENRQLVMSRVQEASEASFELDFTEIALFCLDDADPMVRERAIDTLWYQEDTTIMRRLMRLMQHDESEEVRARAAIALGRFVMAGELEELEASALAEVENALLAAHTNPDAPFELRRRALEAVSFSSRKEIEGLIKQADQHDDLKMRVSSLFAMGRHGGQQWNRRVLEMLHAEEPELLFEATRAAGELGLAEAVDRLSELVRGSDREIQEMAIWALGEIGGEDVQQLLFALADQVHEEELAEIIEDALNMAMLGSGDLYLLDFEDGFDDEDTPDEDEAAILH